jgi:hypothetical protein
VRSPFRTYFEKEMLHFSLHHQTVEEIGYSIECALRQRLEILEQNAVYSNNFIVCKTLKENLL